MRRLFHPRCHRNSGRIARRCSVGAFRYLPAEAAKDPVAPNRIHNTALGKIVIDRDVNVYVRDAVFAELRFVGVRTNDPARVLTGDIQEFLVDDLGYSVDWTLRIRYTLTDTATKAVLFSAVTNLQRRTAKFANALGAMNENLKLSVEQLLDDAAFARAIDPQRSGFAPAGASAIVGELPAAGPAPRPAAAAPGAIDDVDRVPVSERGRAAYREWLHQKKPRAFVISDNGWFYSVWGTRPPNPEEPSDPTERALKRCRDAGRPNCRAYAIDDRVISPAAADAR